MKGWERWINWIVTIGTAVYMAVQYIIQHAPQG